MDKLIYTDRKTSSKKSLIIEYARYVITGAIMGIGAFMVFKSQFGLKAGGGPVPMRHMACSAASERWPRYNLDAVRCGRNGIAGCKHL